MKKLIEEYLKRCERKKASRATLIQYRRVLERFSEKVDFPPAGNKVDNYIATLALAPASIRLHATIIGQFFEWCVRNKHLDRNPMKDDVAVPRAPRTLPCVADADAVRAVVLGPNVPMVARIAIGLGFFCGLRCSEIAHLPRAAVSTDVENPASVEIRVFGKGRKERVVVAGASFAPLLVEFARSGDSVLLFGPHGVDEATIWRWVKKYVGVNPHALRHAMGVEAARAGIPAATIAEFMGHSSLNTTLRYMNMAGKDLTKLADAIG